MPLPICGGKSNIKGLETAKEHEPQQRFHLLYKFKLTDQYGAKKRMVNMERDERDYIFRHDYHNRVGSLQVMNIILP